MKTPKPPEQDRTLRAEVRVAYGLGWQAGYKVGFRDGNPGRRKTAAKSPKRRAKIP